MGQLFVSPYFHKHHTIGISRSRPVAGRGTNCGFVIDVGFPARKVVTAVLVDVDAGSIMNFLTASLGVMCAATGTILEFLTIIVCTVTEIH